MLGIQKSCPLFSFSLSTTRFLSEATSTPNRRRRRREKRTTASSSFSFSSPPLPHTHTILLPHERYLKMSPTHEFAGKGNGVRALTVAGPIHICTMDFRSSDGRQMLRSLSILFSPLMSDIFSSRKDNIFGTVFRDRAMRVALPRRATRRRDPRGGQH